jgi:3,4-dihydroxy 2-butanone 4-phosphate synthase/GTP cyclohydrolase II
VDYARIAGLTSGGGDRRCAHMTRGARRRPALAAFCAEHGLKVGTVADLIHYRMANERTIERVREGEVETRYGVSS